jgi:transmembrane sensor
MLEVLRRRFLEPAVRETAAQWVARQHEGLTSGEAAELRRWLAADAAHQREFDEQSAAWAWINRPRSCGQSGEVGRMLARRLRQRKRRRVALWSAAGAAAGMIAFFSLSESPVERPLPTGVSLRPDVRQLADGSRVQLNLDAQIEADYSGDRRHVHLLRGEALFAVAMDPARPFVVEHGPYRIRAVGTAFLVRRRPQELTIVVTEGSVRVDQLAPESPGDPEAVGAVQDRTAPTQAPSLTAGQRAVLAIGETVGLGAMRIEALSAAELAGELAWRNHRVEFSATPLSDAVELFNLRNAVKLSIADPELRHRKISGIFWTSNPEGFVRLLESGVGVQALRNGDTIFLHSR